MAGLGFRLELQDACSGSLRSFNLASVGLFRAGIDLRLMLGLMFNHIAKMLDCVGGLDQLKRRLRVDLDHWLGQRGNEAIAHIFDRQLFMEAFRGVPVR
jgi:hypothetical protein